MGLLPYYKGFSFDHSTWDGSDLFMPENRWEYIVSPKAVKVTKAAKLTNVRLIPLTKEENGAYYITPNERKPRI